MYWNWPSSTTGLEVQIVDSCYTTSSSTERQETPFWMQSTPITIEVDTAEPVEREGVKTKNTKGSIPHRLAYYMNRIDNKRVLCDIHKPPGGWGFFKG